MKRRLGVQDTCVAGMDPVEAMPYIKKAGFDCYFVEVSDMKRVSERVEAGNKVGLSCEFIHAYWHCKAENGSRYYMNEFWKEGDTYKPLFDATVEAIDTAAALGIPGICQHVTSGWVAPKACELGFKRFDALVEYAVKKGVKFTLENLRNYGLLAALLERYEQVPEVGFCYDNGHEHCYTETVPFLDLWGTRTFFTHLHDNYGRDKDDPDKDADYHLLPYDGNFDYSEMIRRMDKYGYEGALTLEVCQYGKYKEMEPQAFLDMLYARAVKLSKGEM